MRVKQVFRPLASGKAVYREPGIARATAPRDGARDEPGNPASTRPILRGKHGVCSEGLLLWSRVCSYASSSSASPASSASIMARISLTILSASLLSTFSALDIMLVMLFLRYSSRSSPYSMVTLLRCRGVGSVTAPLTTAWPSSGVTSSAPTFLSSYLIR